MTWKRKKGKTSKFVDAETSKWNEREGNKQYGMDRHGRMENKNKIKVLDKKRCENVDTLNKNKKCTPIKEINRLGIAYENNN